MSQGSFPSQPTPGTTSGEPVVGHGRLRLVEDRCTSCMICARECPTWCIQIEAHTEARTDVPAGSRERHRNVLDSFEIDWALCMYCGICVDECPFDALEWAGSHVEAASSREGLTRGRSELA